jgi:carboxylate-amine ligase
VRHGIDGHLIDFGKRVEVPLRALVEELLELVDDVLDPLGIRAEATHARTILREGTSADRQLAVYRESQSLTRVVEHLVAETLLGCS